MRPLARTRPIPALRPRPAVGSFFWRDERDRIWVLATILVALFILTAVVLAASLLAGSSSRGRGDRVRPTPSGRVMR